MKKIFVFGAIFAAIGASACTPDPSTQYVDQQPVQQVQQQGGFLDRHGDAVVAGVAGLAAGKMLSRPHYQPTRTIIVNRAPARVYYTRPVYRSTVRYTAPSRSSSRGVYRSRR